MVKNIFKLLGGRSVAFNTGYLKLGMGVNAALMLGQAVYWSERTTDADGWFYKTQADWQEEIGLSRYEQETARKQLVKLGVFDEVLRGLPAKMHFRVDFDRLCLLASQYVENQQTSTVENRAPVSGKPAHTDAGNPQTFSIHKITHKTTTEITDNLLDADAPKKQPNKKPAAAVKKSKACELDFSGWPQVPSPQVLEDFLQNRKEKRISNSQGAINRVGAVLHRLARHGFSVDQCLIEFVDRPWTGFKDEYFINAFRGTQAPANFGSGQMAPRGGHSTRNAPIDQQLTDRSWAGGLLTVETSAPVLLGRDDDFTKK